MVLKMLVELLKEIEKAGMSSASEPATYMHRCDDSSSLL
jgi:hypothetical protein